MTVQDPIPHLLSELGRTDDNLAGHRRRLVETMQHIRRLEAYRDEVLADLAVRGVHPGGAPKSDSRSGGFTLGH